ncbi:MAG: hypothetical protein H0U03_01480 [Actinobacteria bacterium]|nr:hypothetical protein [Actinomycetota bacterium]
MTAALVASALLAVVCVLLVAWPFLREPAPPDDRLQSGDALTRRRVELTEERDRALAALKELEFDHRTGKVSDDDYRALLGPLRERAASTLRALELRTDRPQDQTAVSKARASRDARPLESQEVDP